MKSLRLMFGKPIQWDMAYHNSPQCTHPEVADQFRMGKEACAKGKEAEATQYLGVPIHWERRVAGRPPSGHPSRGEEGHR